MTTIALLVLRLCELNKLFHSEKKHQRANSQYPNPLLEILAAEQNLYHVFIDVTMDMILWTTTTKHNITCNTNIMRVIENLHDKEAQGLSQNYIWSPTRGIYSHQSFKRESFVVRHWMTMMVVSASDDGVLPDDIVVNAEEKKRLTP